MMHPATATLEKRFMNPGAPARLGLLVIVLFLMAMAGWGALAPLSGAVVANGVLQAEAGRQSVQHPYGGVVAELRVREGDTVKAGDVLLRLSDSEPRAQRDVLSAERDTLLAAQGRLLAERDGATAPAFPDDLLSRRDEPGVQQAMASEIALMAARTRQNQTAADVLRQGKAQLTERIAAAQAQIEGLKQQRGSIAGELADARQLLAQQLIARNRVLELERAVSDIDAQLGVQRTDIAAAQKAMTEADVQIDALARQQAAQVNEDLRANEAALATLAPKLDAARDALARTDVLAPATGTVVGLSVLTEGGVIAAGQQIAGIVPTDGPMIVEAQMQLSDVSDVVAGERADLRLLGVPATTRPHLSGTVSTVSADRLVDERSGQAYYALRVALDGADVAAAGVPLQAGMPVQVVIPTRGRTLFDYLAGPLLDELGGAFRER